MYICVKKKKKENELVSITFTQGFPGGSVVKNLPECRRCKRQGFDPWVGKISWRRKWQPTPVFLPGKSHGQRTLTGYSPWGHKELDMTEQLNAHTHSVTFATTKSSNGFFFFFQEITQNSIFIYCEHFQKIRSSLP